MKKNKRRISGLLLLKHRQTPVPLKFEPVLVVMALLLTSLACSAPAGDVDLSVPGLPPSTPAPTPAPEDAAAPTAPPVSGSQEFTGEGVKSDFSSDGAVCLVQQPVTLVVQGDGTAELTTVGAGIIDHINCTAGTEETWYINGMVDAAAQTVTFQTCNFGHFTAAGSLSFAQGVLAGQVSCTNNEGVKFITVVIGQ